ncbi:cytochrome P450 [Microdochium bolleyi]|uniref:Cytochrome P450 n=1 Tax=Microdochium bolleyi TaxID=196109 RepID=A0A136JFN7_9PEZI|nr:cytochrome P450 [Microdochium bolleyi]
MGEFTTQTLAALRDNPGILAALFPASIACYVVGRGVYNILFHPLRAFPGPFLFRLTVFTKTYYSIKGTLPFLVKDLHDQYGPVVRISPTELSFADPAAAKDIYGHRLAATAGDLDGHAHNNTGNTRASGSKLLPEFPKLDEQVRISASRPNNILNAPTHEEHAFLRRKLAPGFSDRSMRAQEPVINGYVDLLIRRLRERATGTEGGTVDIKTWMNWTTFDVIGNLGFGSDFGCLESGEGHPWVETMNKGFVHIAKLAALQQIGLGGLVGAFMDSNLVPSFVRNREYVRNKMRERLERGNDRFDFMQGFVEGKEKLPFDYILSTAAILILAGSETTATLLTGAVFLLLANPDKLAKVTEEIRTTFADEKDISLSSVQQQLPYLLACLDESLRCYPPAMVGMARVVRDEGGAVICGTHVPKNTTVAVWQWVTNHDSKHWHDPYSFHPERFLRREESDTDDDDNDNDDATGQASNPFANDNLDALVPFSTGPRNCIGKSLAYAEMRLIMARLLYTFDMSLAPCADDGSGGAQKDPTTWLSTQKAFFNWEKPPLMVKLKVAQ